MESEKLTPLKRFGRLIALERKDILQVTYYAVFSGIVALSLPLGIQAIVNLIQGAQISTSWIVLVTLVTVGVVFVGILNLMQLRIIETIQQRIFVKASFELSYRFPKMKMEELRNLYAPELANRFFDTISIQKGISKVLVEVPASLLQIFFALILLSFYHPLFIVLGILLLGAVYFVFQYTAKRGLETSLEESKYKYKVAEWIQGIARATISFKLSGKTNLALEKNDVLVSKYLDARERHFNIIRIQYMKMIGFKAIITAGLLVIGGILVLNQQMNIGQFVAAEIIILTVINSVEKLILGLETLYDMLASIEKLGLVFDKSLESHDGEILNYDQGIHIELNSISCKVPNREEPILKNVSLKIEPNSRILIQGKRGAGKSTLFRILSGISSPSSGDIYINGFSIKGVNISHYRQQLGMSLTDEYPFEGTLKENLTFGNTTISNEEIINTLKSIGLTNFLKELNNGLDTHLIPDGKQISTSVAKKIVLARALLKKPKLLILEDALDHFNDHETKSIIKYLSDPSHSWALIVVSSNEYWKNYCPEVLELKNGEII